MMKQIIQNYHELSQSVKNNCKDSSLLANLQKSLFTLQPQAIDPEIYSRLMLSVYDLSNHYTLTQNVNQNKESRIIMHSLGVRLKLISMRMICILIQLLMRNSNNLTRLDKQIEVQALQIMILSIRVCLDSEIDCLHEIMENQKFCSLLHSYYCPVNTFQLGRNRNSPITEQMEILYYLNQLDFMRLTIDAPIFLLPQLESCLKMLYNLLQNDFAASRDHKSKYLQYISNVVTEITLKLLRQGNNDCLQSLKAYLPEGVRKTIEKLLNGDLPINEEVSISEVYQLYWHIYTNGMQSINFQSLQKFMAKPQVFQSQQIFQAILLINQPILLEIWFNESNRKISKPPNIIQAYQCFIYMAIGFINKDKFKSASTFSSQTQESEQTKTNDMVRLCKQIMLNLLRQSKDLQALIYTVCQYISKFMLQLVTNLYNYDMCRQLFENLYLVCNRHSLTDINKTVSSLHLYYDLINHSENEETYKKFMKANNNDKSETLKLLRICYEMQKGNTQIDENSMKLVKTKPQFALLFCEPAERTMLILSIDSKYLASMSNIFQIYSTLFEQNQWNDDNLLKIANSLQTLLLSTQYTTLLFTQSSSQKLKLVLGKMIKKQNPIFCILFLYLSCFTNQFDKVKNQHYGAVFNKYSKILKMLDLVTLDLEIVNIMKIVICKTCQKFKKIVKQCDKFISQAGQIMFIKILYQTLQKYIKNIPNSNQKQNQQNSQQFVKFSIFQIFCINNRQDELQQMIDEEQNTKLQQFYISSPFIPKKSKLILLRKLFKSNINTVKSEISLNDMKELILLAQSPQQSYIYITSTLQMFGEKGRRFINLLAEENEKISQLCLQVFGNGQNNF